MRRMLALFTLRGRHVACTLLIALVMTLASFAAAPSHAQQQGPPARVGKLALSSVADWEAGSVSGILVTNNAGGELRLADGQNFGSFVSPALKTGFPINAAGAQWRADVLDGTQLLLEVRARATPPDGDPESGWGPWQPLVAGDARSAASGSAGAFATPDVLALPADTQYLQLRVTLGSQIARASPVLEEVTLSYLNTTAATPIFAAGLPRRPILFGPPTLTQRPTVISRADWSGSIRGAQPVRGDPRGVIIHQIDASPTPAATLDFVRALTLYQTDVLGWEDLSYHYLIDAEGNLFEGRLGGPTSRVPRLAGDDAAVHVALIAPRDATATSAATGSLVSLLAWLGEAYAIPPTGNHVVVLDGQRQTRLNIAGHNDVAPEAPDPFPPLRGQLAQIRTQADASTVRARWYFAEGNVADYSQRFTFFNPTGAQADARVNLIRIGGAPTTRIVSVPPNGRADLTVNDLVQDAPALPAIVESSAPILVERTMSLTTDIDGGPGITELSRVWYFAEGSTEGNNRTYLILFNPGPTTVQATVNYFRRDGLTFEQPVTVGAQSRLVISVHDITLPDGSRPLLGANFGGQVIASQPIAVERTLRFGPAQAGLHTGRGITTLARRWHFAEGTTEGDFRMRLLVLNPNTQPARTVVTFMGPDSRAETRRYAVPPRSQLSINANEIAPNLGFSSLVEADRPIAVERALIFNGGAAGTISAGAAEPALRWAFVDGRTRDTSYILCVSNPGRLAARVTVDFNFSGGATGQQTFEVPAGARYTLSVHELYPDEDAVSAVVRSTQPIVAERSLFPGGGARGGATALGIPTGE
ncbi:MAG: peptidoglycan recognition family protein [Oscillochloridaceae bacterium]|nr:peptidoglycan recognition protein family protein [Chloroflexaceae bacterium]MDW8390066.1 peptidoglycan recognition family protein [Oscillochloridaceae bacterium]